MNTDKKRRGVIRVHRRCFLRGGGGEFRAHPRSSILYTRAGVQRSRALISITLGGALCWGADWLTDGYDTRRTAWQRDEKILSTDSVKNMKLLWKLPLDNQAREMHALFPPLIVGKVNTPSGPKEIAIEAGVSDN